MTNFNKQAADVQDALTDCVNNLKYLGKCVDELIHEAAKEPEATGDIIQAAKWLGEGKKVTRQSWCWDGGYIHVPLGQSAIRYRAKSSYGDYVWNLRHDDLLATDWVVFKDE